MTDYAFDDRDFNREFADAPTTDDLVTGIVLAYQTLDEAAALRSLLNEDGSGKLVADIEWPTGDSFPRPYVIVTQANFDNVYYAQGLGSRVDKIIIQFRAFTDTRQQATAILNALDTFYGGVDLGLAVGQPVVADKVVSLDLDKLDAYRAQLNLVYFTQTTPA